MKRFTTEEIEYIKDKHEKISGTDIAKKLNRPYGSVKNKIRELGLSGTAIGGSKFSRKKRTYNCNDNFFSIPTILNSYWAGFISADGCIRDINENNKQLTLHLAIKDLEHIQRFKKDLDSNNPILYSQRGEFKSAGLNLTSKKIVEDLEKFFNITPRKTFTNIPPNLEDPDMIDSFIMGYIDGDGGIYLNINKNNKTRLRLSLLGTLDICKWILNRSISILKRETGSISKIRNMHNLIFGCKASRGLVGHFKKLPVPYLYRKWDKGLNLEIADNERGYHVRKSIIQMDPITGEELMEFSSAVEANKYLGIDPKNTSICNHIAGRIKKAHNYKWKYK